MAAIVNSTIVQLMYNMLEGGHHVSEIRSKPILDGTWLSYITNVLGYNFTQLLLYSITKGFPTTEWGVLIG